MTLLALKTGVLLIGAGGTSMGRKSFASVFPVILVALSIGKIAFGGPLFVSFDETRSADKSNVGEAWITGPGCSFSLGDAYSDARSSISSHFPASSFVAVPELTSEALSGKDVFVSGLLAQYQDLQSSEQSALFDFVAGGGAAVIFGELDTFLDASNSLVDPFAVSFAGELWSPMVTATITDATHPIASGPFGTVETFTERYVTSVADLGAHASVVATNPLGDTLVVIPRGALGPQSGPVVIFSDLSLFLGPPTDTPLFEENETLFLNTVSWAVPEPATLLLVALGSLPMTRRRR
jgi:hypothetical protein